MKIKVLISRQENANYFNCQINEIKEIELEEYVAAVVASEIGNSNFEACCAQAIAARTYAINYGVLKGKVISDDSSVAQAYRAPRYNMNIYPNCINAAYYTEGQILIYNNQPISAVYSSCNGGHTVSCKEKWGNEVPYLIAQDDPWDAATNKPKNGHGVGMSQTGIIYGGKHSISYKDMLQFYYPGTSICNYIIKVPINKLVNLQNNIKKIGEEL